jgi:hypothetical protein
MCSMHSSSFFISPLNDSAYELKIQFEDMQGGKTNHSFVFIQTPIKEGKIFDVFTKNGKCSPDILANLFETDDLKELSYSMKQLGSVNNDPLVAVFDLKDPNQGYLSCYNFDASSIEKCEDVVCEFFKGKYPEIPKEASEIYHFAKNELPLDFLIQEGTLKKNILQKGGFTEQQVEYLNANHGKGAIAFCQLAEFFMNAFKTGQETKNGGDLFQAQSFIKPISSRFDVFYPCSTSIVYYPSLYKKIYSPEGAFAQTLSHAFDITGKFYKKTHITSLQMEKKKS